MLLCSTVILYTVSDYQLFTSPHFFTLQLPPLEKTGTQPKLDLVQPLDSAPPLSSTLPPSTPPPPTTSQSGSMSLSATVRERLRTKLLKAKVTEGGREGEREGGKEGGRKGGREGGREGGRKIAKVTHTQR